MAFRVLGGTQFDDKKDVLLDDALDLGRNRLVDEEKAGRCAFWLGKDV